MVQRLLVLWVLASACAGATAAQDMVLGRMVQAPADAPSRGTTTHVRAHYVLHCAGCHGVDGAGSIAGYVPDLRRLGDFLRVPGGREFVIKVPGVMGSGLDDAQVAAVTNWVLQQLAAASVPPDFKPFEAHEVTRARATPLIDVMAERRSLVQAGRGVGVGIE